MRSVSLALAFILLAASGILAQQVNGSTGTVITTSKSKLTLTPLESFNSESGLKSAGRTAEIAIGEVSADVAALVKEETALVKEIAAYEVTKEAEQAAFDLIKKKYDERLAKYEIILTPLTARILAFNALPIERRDAVTHDKLAAEKAAIDLERSGLEVEKVAGDKSKAEGEARLKLISDPLQVKIKVWNTRMGLAYRQLKLCADYAAEINKKLKESYGGPGQPEGSHPGYNPNGKYPVLNKAMEQLKALSGRGFDTP
jgi:hypothetical protein